MILLGGTTFCSGVAQWKPAWLITKRSCDRNTPPNEHPLCSVSPVVFCFAPTWCGFTSRAYHAWVESASLSVGAFSSPSHANSICTLIWHNKAGSAAAAAAFVFVGYLLYDVKNLQKKEHGNDATEKRMSREREREREGGGLMNLCKYAVCAV